MKLRNNRHAVFNHLCHAELVSASHTTVTASCFDLLHEALNQHFDFAQ